MREQLRTIIEILQGILVNLEHAETCQISSCNRTAAARKLCTKHYNEWRRRYCKDHQINRLRDEPKVVEPDPRQVPLFSEDRPTDNMPETFEF